MTTGYDMGGYNGSTSAAQPLGTGRFDVKSPDTEALRAKKRALNDPIVDCCGRDAADCDCPPEQPYLTTLGAKVRPASSGDEAFDTAFNAGRDAVLNAARVTRNPLAGVLSGDDRQALIAIMTAAHSDRSLRLRLVTEPGQRDTALAQVNQVTRIAHVLGLHLDA